MAIRPTSLPVAITQTCVHAGTVFGRTAARLAGMQERSVSVAAYRGG